MFPLIFLACAAFAYCSAIVATGLTYKPVSSDLAVVLGNEVLASGKPSSRLKARLDCALELYRKGMVGRILVSGGKGKSGYDEAKVMGHYLASQSMPEKNILIDSEGVNTRATARNTARIAYAKHLSRIIIVSQYYHLPRCMLAFQKAGLNSLSADYPRYFEFGDLIAIPREAVALPVYLIKMSFKE